MFYIRCRETLDSKWEFVRNVQDNTRLIFVSEDDARLSTIELARQSKKQFIAIDGEGFPVSLIYSTVNPYKNLI